jgi:hypothetical protein
MLLQRIVLASLRVPGQGAPFALTPISVLPVFPRVLCG